MDPVSQRLSLAVQEHPAGRVELSKTQSYVQQFRRRDFSDGDVSELFHANTTFDRRYLTQSELTNDDLPESVSVVEQDYHSCETVALPNPDGIDTPLGAVLDRRRSVRTFTDRGVTPQTLGTLLGHAIAPTEERDGELFTETFRPYPSAGGLYPIEVYPVVVDGSDIADGVYYYSPRSHALRRIDEADSIAEFEAAFMDAPFSRGIVSNAAVTCVLTGSFGRIKAKYGPVGYRFALYEAGHVAQNLLLVAEAMGMGGVALGSFFDDELDELLGVDGVNESALYPIALGYPQNHD